MANTGDKPIPLQPIRKQHDLRVGSDLLLFKLSNGQLVLKRFRKPKKSLVWHLRQLRGLRLEHKTEPVRELAL